MDAPPFEIPLQRIRDEITDAAGVTLYILRTDLNHPHISGNKLFKLKYNLQEAKSQEKDTIITFGGAYSNHIAATAAAGKEYGFRTIGIIRGERPKVLNEVLAFAERQGMELQYVSREAYRLKDDLDFIPKYLAQLNSAQTISNYYIIPEGGANALGVKGCIEITAHIPVPFDLICCACGTGTTLAGIILSLKEGQKALGFQVLKGKRYIYGEVKEWLDAFESAQNDWDVNEEYHFGGYAKSSGELKDFIGWFEAKHKVPLDEVYVGKMMYGVYEEMRSGVLEGKVVVVVHTGGWGNAIS